MVYAAGAGKQLVAVSAYSDYPGTAKILPQVGDSANIDLERLVQLKPDLVLAWKSNISPFSVERLRRLGVPVWVSEARTLADVAARMREIGTLAGTLDSAEQAAQNFEQQLIAIRQSVVGKMPLTTFIEVWHDPLLSVNSAHIMSEVVALCGGRNILRDAKVLTPSIGLETLLEANPQAIIGGGSAFTVDHFRRTWQRHPSLQAVQRGAIFYVNPDWIQRATPRILLGAKVICDGLDAARKRIGY